MFWEQDVPIARDPNVVLKFTKKVELLIDSILIYVVLVERWSVKTRVPFHKASLALLPW